MRLFGHIGTIREVFEQPVFQRTGDASEAERLPYKYLASCVAYCTLHLITNLATLCRLIVSHLNRFKGVDSPFTIDLKLISFTNPFLHSHPSGLPSRI